MRIAGSETTLSGIVSVIIEGHNEPLSSAAKDGPLCQGLRGLLEQDFPLNRVDLVMAVDSAQIERWQRQTEGLPFNRIVFLPADHVDYYQMKQMGAEAATTSILAFLDSDVFPSSRWLTTLVEAIESGFDVSAGLTQLHWRGRFRRGHPLMLAFGCISWGAILGDRDAGGLRVLGFHANNVGFRGELLQVAGYRPGLLRACAAHSLFLSWKQAGCRVSFRPEQRVDHTFTPGWWSEMHTRAGLESLVSRRVFQDWPQRWVRRFGVLEPALTAAWRSCRDPLQWWRYTAASGVSRTRRIAWLPVLLPVSMITRGVEMLGAYKGLLCGDLDREVLAYRRAVE